MNPLQIKKVAKKYYILRKRIIKVGFIINTILAIIFVIYLSTGALEYEEKIKAVLGISLFLIFLFLIMLSSYSMTYGLWKKLLKTPNLFCAQCKKYIPDDSPWVCPYCDTHNAMGVNSIFLPCKNCGNETDFLLCPFCKNQILISKQAGDGKVGKIEKSILDNIGNSIDEFANEAQHLDIENEYIKEGIKSIAHPFIKERAEQRTELAKIEAERRKYEAEAEEKINMNNRVKAEIEQLLANKNITYHQGKLLERIEKEMDLKNLDPQQAYIWVKTLSPNADADIDHEASMIEEKLNKLKAEAQQEQTKADWERYKFDEDSKKPVD